MILLWYTPPPREIKDEADRVAYAGMSITEMEVGHATLTGGIRRHSFFYLRQTSVPQDADAATRAIFVEGGAKVARLKALIKTCPRPVPCRMEPSEEMFQELRERCQESFSAAGAVDDVVLPEVERDIVAVVA